ncbi:TetR/AcrR family transcriptional regulator [Acinetobacter sp. MD2(2019)]|uniref:TetR/AcrR family transcriptional regulator n=1 Tax=Acinetobacter sp. MD2(2019) TaxID=2605273 RepID=UPI002D1ED33C|nr:TetR/AcrR family transcriptional regulator [Acinetobacter sp. MD2(2019)]MEB3753041.1 TetR/AcrR family transcriptional regulator [Acinetobacter sp. MD2(2019)]
MSQIKAGKTKQRILDVSLQLFNEKSERAITTNHIAAELNMSPGNLYYHFANKQDIIKAITEQYQNETLKMLALPEGRPVNANDKIHYFHVMSSQLWRYRFIHRDIFHLVENDQSFKLLYANFSQQVMQQVQKIYQAFVAVGLMKLNANEIEALILNIWIVLTNWTNFLFMSGRLQDQNDLDEKWRIQALRQLIFLEGPYVLGESRIAYEKLLSNIEHMELFATEPKS